jgi:hypothetical protein
MNARPVCIALVVALWSGAGCRPAPVGSPGGDSSVPSAASAPSTNAALQPPRACPITVSAIRGDNLPQLQAAVDQANAFQCGDIVLGPGNYELSAPLQLRSGVRITGQRFKRAFSTLRPMPGFRGKSLLLTRFAPDTSERKQTEFYLERLRLEATPDCPKHRDCLPAKVEVGLWLENTVYPTIRDCEFSNFPESGAGIRGGGVLYLKLLDSRFMKMLGWSVDLSLNYPPKKPGGNKPNTYYAVSVGIIQRNHFETRRGIRLTPGFSVTIRDNQFEGGLSMIHAYEAASSALVIEDNFFEVRRTPQDVPDRGTIAVRGSGRIVGNLLHGPAKGKQVNYPGPAIEVMAGASITLGDNTVRCFEPGVSVAGTADPPSIVDRGNLIGRKAHVGTPWEFSDVPEPPPVNSERSTE